MVCADQQVLYNLAIPLLYTSVVCDDLNALLYVHPTSNSSPRLAGKTSHLALVKRLYLEYNDKSTADDLSEAYQTELSDVHRAFHNPLFAAPHGTFPHLQNLAMGSIYGAPPRTTWYALCRPFLNNRVRNELAQPIPRLLLSPDLQHVCQRSGGLLFNFPDVLTYPSPALSSAVLTTHIKPGERDWSIPLGVPCRWVLEAGPHRTFKAVRAGVESVLSTVGSYRHSKYSRADVTDRRFLLNIYAPGLKPPSNVDIGWGADPLPPGWRYEGDSAIFLPDLEEKDLEEEVKKMKGMMWSRVKGDEIRWLGGAQAGRCGACED